MYLSLKTCCWVRICCLVQKSNGADSGSIFICSPNIYSLAALHLQGSQEQQMLFGYVFFCIRIVVRPEVLAASLWKNTLTCLMNSFCLAKCRPSWYRHSKATKWLSWVYWFLPGAWDRNTAQWVRANFPCPVCISFPVTEVVQPGKNRLFLNSWPEYQ